MIPKLGSIVDIVYESKLDNQAIIIRMKYKIITPAVAKNKYFFISKSKLLPNIIGPKMYINIEPPNTVPDIQEKNDIARRKLYPVDASFETPVGDFMISLDTSVFKYEFQMISAKSTMHAKIKNEKIKG